MNAVMADLWPYFVLILVGYLPNEIWRVLGLVLARGLNEDSEVVMWSRAVATAILAGVIAKLILFSSGALDSIPLPVRIGAAVCGFIVFSLVKRSVFAGVIAGEACALIHDIPPAGEIVERIVAEAERVIRSHRGVA